MIIKLITTSWLNMVCIIRVLVFECPGDIFPFPNATRGKCSRWILLRSMSCCFASFLTSLSSVGKMFSRSRLFARLFGARLGGPLRCALQVSRVDVWFLCCWWLGAPLGAASVAIRRCGRGRSGLLPAPASGPSSSRSFSLAGGCLVRRCSVVRSLLPPAPAWVGLACRSGGGCGGGEQNFLRFSMFFL